MRTNGGRRQGPGGAWRWMLMMAWCLALLASGQAALAQGRPGELIYMLVDISPSMAASADKANMRGAPGDQVIDRAREVIAQRLRDMPASDRRVVKIITFNDRTVLRRDYVTEVQKGSVESFIATQLPTIVSIPRYAARTTIGARLKEVVDEVSWLEPDRLEIYLFSDMEEYPVGRPTLPDGTLGPEISKEKAIEELNALWKKRDPLFVGDRLVQMAWEGYQPPPIITMKPADGKSPETVIDVSRTDAEKSGGQTPLPLVETATMAEVAPISYSLVSDAGKLAPGPAVPVTISGVMPSELLDNGHQLHLSARLIGEDATTRFPLTLDGSPVLALGPGSFTGERYQAVPGLAVPADSPLLAMTPEAIRDTRWRVSLEPKIVPEPNTTTGPLAGRTFFAPSTVVSPILINVPSTEPVFRVAEYGSDYGIRIRSGSCREAETIPLTLVYNAVAAQKEVAWKLEGVAGRLTQGPTKTVKETFRLDPAVAAWEGQLLLDRTQKPASGSLVLSLGGTEAIRIPIAMEPCELPLFVITPDHSTEREYTPGEDLLTIEDGLTLAWNQEAEGEQIRFRCDSTAGIRLAFADAPDLSVTLDQRRIRNLTLRFSGVAGLTDDHTLLVVAVRGSEEITREFRLRPRPFLALKPEETATREFAAGEDELAMESLSLAWNRPAIGKRVAFRLESPRGVKLQITGATDMAIDLDDSLNRVLPLRFTGLAKLEEPEAVKLTAVWPGGEIVREFRLLPNVKPLILLRPDTTVTREFRAGSAEVLLDDALTVAWNRRAVGEQVRFRTEAANAAIRVTLPANADRTMSLDDKLARVVPIRFEGLSRIAKPETVRVVAVLGTQEVAREFRLIPADVKIPIVWRSEPLPPVVAGCEELAIGSLFSITPDVSVPPVTLTVTVDTTDTAAGITSVVDVPGGIPSGNSTQFRLEGRSIVGHSRLRVATASDAPYVVRFRISVTDAGFILTDGATESTTLESTLQFYALPAVFSFESVANGSLTNNFLQVEGTRAIIPLGALSMQPASGPIESTRISVSAGAWGATKVPLQLVFEASGTSEATLGQLAANSNLVVDLAPQTWGEMFNSRGDRSFNLFLTPVGTEGCGNPAPIAATVRIGYGQ